MKLFNRKKANIDLIFIPNFEWLVQKGQKNVKVWINPEETVALSLHFFDLVPDLPSIKDVNILRDFYRENISQNSGALVKVDMIELKGFTTVKTIFKFPQDPTGMTYLASLTIPFANYSYVIKIQAAEVGITGMRDSLVLSEFMADDKVSLEDDKIVGWFADPYDDSIKEGLLMNKSEQEIYDSQFPEHPLSQARGLLKQIEEEIEFNEKLEKLDKFEK